MIRNQADLLAQLRDIHAAIRDAVVSTTERTAMERLATPVAEEGGDTIFAIDRVSEDVLVERFGALAREWPLVLIAEGLGATGQLVLPQGASAEQAELRVIVDPIDGTRGLMYQKRPAWILTGVAPNRGAATSLADIELALMTEIPLLRQHLCDSLWSVAGQGAQAERLNRLTGEWQTLAPQPSRATTIAQGYGGLARFFPGARDVLAAVDESVIDRVLGPQPAGAALAFEDQYISTGGQLYELLMGHDRWVADLRPLVEPLLRRRGKPRGLCCHPYDLCAELIAREAGVVVTDAHGRQLDAPLDVTSDVAWVGYANGAIRDQVAPALLAALEEHGLLLRSGAIGTTEPL
ncbi:MAG: inositol monophosphatase [Kouleothrix sp.]|nr:inositol monophosphatase [Kouleothrix sp.]